MLFESLGNFHPTPKMKDLKLINHKEFNEFIKGKGFKDQLQRFYKLVSYERAVKILKNDICITEISLVVLEISEFKVKFPRKIKKIRIFANVSIIRVEQ